MNMKRILAALLCAAMILALCACNTDVAETTDTSDNANETTETTTASTGETTTSIFDGILETQKVTAEEIVLPLEEVANAVKI